MNQNRSIPTTSNAYLTVASVASIHSSNLIAMLIAFVLAFTAGNAQPILKAKGLTYIGKKEPSIHGELSVTPAKPLTVFIRGMVVDQYGNQMKGVSINLIGMKQDAVSDANGHFAIDIASWHRYATVQISVPGFKTIEREIDLNDFAATGGLTPLVFKLEAIDENFIRNVRAIQSK